MPAATAAAAAVGCQVLEQKTIVQHMRYMQKHSNIDLNLASLRPLLEIVHHVAAILEQFLLTGGDVLMGRAGLVYC